MKMIEVKKDGIYLKGYFDVRLTVIDSAGNEIFCLQEQNFTPGTTVTFTIPEKIELSDS